MGVCGVVMVVTGMLIAIAVMGRVKWLGDEEEFAQHACQQATTTA